MPKNKPIPTDTATPYAAAHSRTAVGRFGNVIGTNTENTHPQGYPQRPAPGRSPHADRLAARTLLTPTKWRPYATSRIVRAIKPLLRCCGRPKPRRARLSPVDLRLVQA